MNAMDLAKQSLQRRVKNGEPLPTNPPEWGRAFGLSPATAGKLVRAMELATRRD